MKLSRARTLWFLPVAVVGLALLTGCPWDPDKVNGPPIVEDRYLEQSNPRNILQNLQTAYQNKNPDEYEKLLSLDFVFVFNPADVNDPHNPTPPEWPRADEVRSTKNMFQSELVDDITLDWGGEPGAAESAADIFPSFPECQKVTVDQVNLRVETRKVDGEVWIYVVAGQRHVFYFKEGRGTEAYTYAANRKRWHLFHWEDNPIGN